MSFTVVYSPVKRRAVDGRRHNPAAVEALSRTMFARDRQTHEHAERVRHFALELAEEAGVVDDGTLSAIRVAAVLHDVGKLGIPDVVLQKPGPLTTDEYDIVKQHATIGADLVAAACGPGLLPDIVRHHHENWDGTGYPDRLAGGDIPVGARVIAIVDCYDALTSDRPYRPALSHNSALAMIHERRAVMYDPQMTDAFMRLLWRMRANAATRGLPHYVSAAPVHVTDGGGR
jgi:putative nucleotidyltransferase with HDIG domain